jgi:hypothetical protein
LKGNTPKYETLCCLIDKVAVFVLPACGSQSLSAWCLTFPNNVVILSSRVECPIGNPTSNDAAFLTGHSILDDATNILTPRSRVLLEKPSRLQLIKKFSAFYEARMFTTAFTTARHVSLS